MHLLTGFISVLTIAGSAVAQAPAEDTRTIQQIYEAAQKESGTLQVAWGGDEKNQANGILTAFQSAFPKIDINITVDVSKYHDSRINRAFTQGKRLFDVAFLQTLHDFPLWKDQGRLMLYKPPQFGLVYDAIKDSDGAYLPMGFDSFGSFVYSPNVTDVPTSYLDLLKPEWKGKIVLTYPNDDDAVAYLFSLIILTHGWEWFEKLQQQDVRWVRGTATPSTIIKQGNSSRVISFSTSGSTGLLQSPPVADPYVIWPQSGGIFNGTDLPETSKLFTAFVISDLWQSTFANKSSIRKDIDKGAVWLKNNTEPSGFKTWMVQRDVEEWWRLQYETDLGTAQGLSPLIDGI